MAILIDKTKRVLVQGITDREGRVSCANTGPKWSLVLPPGKGGQSVAEAVNRS